MGGGGTSGKVEYPEHITQVHKDWLGYAGTGAGDPITTTLIEVMENALGITNNPYYNVNYNDPSTDITEFETEVTNYKNAVTALSPEDDYDSIVDNAVAKIDTAGVLKDIDTSAIVTAAKSDATSELSEAIKQAVNNVDDTVIADLVKEYEKRSDYARARAVRRFSGQMSDINAVQSSAFVLGMAIIEAEHVQNVNEFNSQISREHYSQHFQAHIDIYKTRLAQEIEIEVRQKLSRDQMLLDSVRLTATMLGQSVEFKRAVAASYLESKRIKYVIDSEYTANQADMDAKEKEWDLRVYEFGGAILGAPGGGARMPEKPAKAGSVIGGALSGAVAGQMAIPIPGVGAAIGATVGGLAGLLQ